MSWLTDLLQKMGNPSKKTRLEVRSALRLGIEPRRSREANYLEAYALRSVNDALHQIQRVHSDGKLPTISLTIVRRARSFGNFFTPRDRLPYIEISSGANAVEFTTLHELGHFLDYSGIDTPGVYASLASPHLRRWRESVKRSAAIQNLQRLGQTATQGILYRGIEYPLEKQYINKYLLDIREIWARSYAQFIAVKSKDSGLLRQLYVLRQRPSEGIYYWSQWDDEDFLEIMAEIEIVFRRLGWL